MKRTLTAWMLTASVLPSGARAAAQAAPRVIDFPNPTGPALQPGVVPQLDLGGSDGAEFHRISAIRPRRDGSFVVANAGSNELRIYDLGGRLLRSFGKGGNGPGEYARIAAVELLRGDTLAVFDPSARRVSILDADGKFVRSISLTSPLKAGGHPTTFVTLSDGTLIVGYSDITRMAPQATAVYFGQHLFRYDSFGRLLAPDGLAFPESEHFVQATPPAMGGVAYWDLAFGRTFTLRSVGTSLLTGDGTDWMVERRASGATVELTYRVRRPLLPVTRQDRDAFRATAASSSSPQQRAVEERLVTEMPYPKTKPAFRRFETDDSGSLWLEEYDRPSEGGTQWIRLDPRVRTARLIRLPARFRALAFASGRIYGVWRDSDDVERVRILELKG